MLKEEVKKIFEGEIYDDKETLARFSKDASIFNVVPALVAAPSSAADIGRLVRFASEHADEGISLTPRSGGSDMSGGPLSESIVLDMTAHMNRILNIAIPGQQVPGLATETIKSESRGASAFVNLEPGVFFRDLDVQTRRSNYFLPCYPASRNMCTLGGMIGNNSGGEKNIAYGKTANFVLELKAVLSDGNEYTIRPLSKADLDVKTRLDNFEGRMYSQMFKLVSENQELIQKARPMVTKNSAGYALWDIWNPSASLGASGAGGEQGVFDLTRLLTGSQGTLGIVTQATMRLEPVRQFSQMIVIFMKDLSRIGDIVVELRKYRPESIESYDDHTLRLAMKSIPQLIKLMGGSAIKLGFKFIPDLLKLVGGLPKLVMMVEFTGDDYKEVGQRVDAALKGLSQFKVKTRVARSAEEAEKYWTIRRESFNLLRKKVKGKQTAPFIDDFAVAPEQLPQFLPCLNQILSQYDLIYTIAGHPGDGNFHIIPLMNLADENQRAIIPQLSDRVYKLVLEYGGTTTAEHNDGLIRTPYLEKMFGLEVVKLFEATKKIFDPQNIFNPGKKVYGNLAYSMSHIKRS